MARIFTYDQDVDLNLNDKVIGSNSTDNVTKNFSVESLLDLANNENFIKQFDGIVFKASDYNSDSDQFGIITTSTGSYTNTPFADITSLHLSFKNLQKELVDNYIDVLAGYDVRITKKGDINNFGIYRVDSINNSTSGTYKILSVTKQDASGDLEKDSEYYISTLGNNLKNLNSFSVTELNDVSSAGSGAIITTAERSLVNTITNRILNTDIVNDLTTGGTAKVLSAEQGKTLKGFIDSINTLLTSDNVNLDTLQEVVDFIEANKSTLDNLSISNIAGLQTALDSKQNTETGKGLSANDFTDALQTKLNSVASGAEVNVQANWTESSSTSDAFIQNKPNNLVTTAMNVTSLADVTSAGSGAIITSAERTKLTSVSSNAEQNVQSNWTETNTNADSFIQNKPTILDQNTTITISGTANEIETSPTSSQDLTTNRTFTIGLPNNVTIGNNLTVTADASADNMTVDNVLSFTSASTTTNDNAIFIKAKDGTNVLHFRYDDKELSIDDVTENIPSGITSGGGLTKANNTQFTIAAGTGIVNDLNKEPSASEPHPEIKHVAWSQQTINCTGLDSGNNKQKNTWIYVDSAGTVNQQTTPFTDAQQAHNIIIGSVIHTSGTIDFVKTFPITAYGAIPQLQEFSRIFGPLKKSGHLVTANGSNLKLNRAAGVAWSFGRNYSSDPNNPSLISDGAKTDAVIHRYYADSSTGHILDSNDGSGYTQIDPTKYDNSSGTLATVASNKFTVQRLYYFPNEINTIVVYYGKEQYDTMADAEKEYQLESFTEAANTAEQAIYLGAVIVKQNTTNLSTASQAKFLTGGIHRSISAIALGGTAAAAQLSDLSDVHVSSPSSNQFLRYDNTDGRFENVTVTTDTITEGSTNKYDQTVAIANGGNMTISGTYPNFTLASAHPTISGAASSVDNSGLTYIQDITLDSNGHVTGLTSTAISTAAVADSGTSLATGDQIHAFVTGQGYLTANQTITLSGDLTGSGTTSIAATIATGAVESGMLNNNIISGQTELASGIAATDELLISDAGTIKRTDASVLKDYMQSALTFTSNTDTDVNVTNLTARLPQITESFTIGDATDVTVTTSGNLTVTGNLTVNGTTTSVNTETVTVDDNIIVLNNNYSGSSPSENGGVQVERGTQTNASLIWNESQDKWYAGLAGAEVQILTTADEGAGNGIDADTLDGQQGSHYLDYSNFTGTPTIPTVNNNTITLTAGTGLSGGEAFTVNQSSDETISFALDFSELTDMTADIGAATEFILQNGSTESRKTANEISLKYFRNDITVTESGGKYYIDGTQQADVTLMPGFKYRFTHPTGHPLRFSTDSNNSSAFTTNVDTSVSGVTEITVEQDTPKTLYYYCSSHANMGGTIYVGAGVRSVGTDTGLTGTVTETGNIGLAINDLTVETTIADADEILFYDATASAHKTITKANFVTATNIAGGAGMTLTGNTMDIDADCRDDIEQIGYSSDNYYKSTASKHQWAFGGTVIMEIDSTNKDLLVDGDVIAFSTSVSDISLKENIETIPDALETINKLRGVEYDWKTGSRKGKHDLGVIAQEVEDVIPHIVHEKELIDGCKVKTVDYEKLSAVLIEAVKELTQKVNNLEKKIEDANS